jgi:hypothetical protein
MTDYHVKQNSKETQLIGGLSLCHNDHIETWVSDLLLILLVDKGIGTTKKYCFINNTRLLHKHNKIDCDQTVMDLPPVTSAVLLIAK